LGVGGCAYVEAERFCVLEFDLVSPILWAMFEALFIGASFFEAAVWFVGGLLFGGIGFAFFVDSLLFRRRAVKKRARILGVIGNKQGKGGQVTYWPVYEHTGVDGERIQTRASTSGSLAGNLPGAARAVLVDPDNPYDVRSCTPIGMIVGIVCLVAGAGLFAISNSVNENMGLVSLLAIALVGVMAAKALVTGARDKPITRGRLGQKWFDKRKKKRIPDLSKILTRDDHLAALRKLDASRRKWLPLVALLALGILAFGIWRGRDLVVLQSIGSRTEAVVVRIESRSNPGSEGSQATYYSVVRFETAGGREVTFRDSIGSNHPIDRRGEVVWVIYDPGDVERAIIDRGIWNWAIPGCCGLLGALILVASLRGLVGAHRRSAERGSPRGEQPP
jgi:hypothetical protein